MRKKIMINLITVLVAFLFLSLWGFSLGGAVALMTAEKSSAVKVVIAESSFARLNWMAYEYYRLPLLRYPLGELTRFWAWLILHYDIKKLSPAFAATKLTIPTLLIHSKQDDVVSFDHALLLQKSLQNNPRAKFLFIEKFHHGKLMEGHDAVVKNFFDANFKEK